MLGEEPRFDCMLGQENGVGLHARRGERAPLPTAFRRWVPSPRALASLVGGTDLRDRNPRRTRTSASLGWGTDLGDRTHGGGSLRGLASPVPPVTITGGHALPPDARFACWGGPTWLCHPASWFGMFENHDGCAPNMKSDAADVEAYLDEVPADRSEAMGRLRTLCVEALPGYEECMDYRMPSYKRPGEEVEVAFASQVNHITVYILRKSVLDRFRDELTNATLGKGTVRYTSPDKIDYDVLNRVLRASSAAEGPIC